MPVEPLQPQSLAALQPQDLQPQELQPQDNPAPLQPQSLAALQPQDLQPQELQPQEKPLQPQEITDGTADALQPQDLQPATQAALPPQGIDNGYVVDQSSFKLWREGRMVHVQFDYQASSPLTLRWEDAQGKRVLGHMQCNGATASGLFCHKARSIDRLRWEQTALGATPGTWTVLGCQGEQCAPLGTFDVAAVQ